MLASFLLDLVFGIDRRLRERQLEIERARQEQIAEGRRQLLEELAAAERARKGSGG